MAALKLPDMKAAFETVIKCFPENTVFEYSSTYVDTVNFLQNVRFKISDIYLNSIPADKRKEMSEALHKSIDDLESLTDKRWAYNAKDDGWSDVIDFIEEKK